MFFFPGKGPSLGFSFSFVGPLGPSPGGCPDARWRIKFVVKMRVLMSGGGLICRKNAVKICRKADFVAIYLTSGLFACLGCGLGGRFSRYLRDLRSVGLSLVWLGRQILSLFA